MKIGIDYLPAVTHWPGVGRYARELVRALVALDECPALALLDVGGQKRTIGEPHLGLTAAPPGRVRRVRRRAPRRLFDGLQRVTGRGVERLLGGVDVFHRIHADWPPIAGALQVQPFGELPPSGSRAEEELGRCFQRVDHVLSMSRHGKAEVERRFGLAPERVHAVPIGTEHWVRQLAEPPARDQPPLVLVLGAVRTVRYHTAILAAFELLHAQGLAGALWCLGGSGDAAAAFTERLAGSPARAAVRWNAQAGEVEIMTAVARASALVHLSEGEESAVTPLEAFSMGTPVVASDLGAFEEALGAEAIWVTNEEAAEDPRYLANAMARAVVSAPDADAEARRRAVAQRFTWRANALGTIDVWRRALGQSS